MGTYHGQVADACASILPEISSRERLYMLCDNGALHYTEDLGETWVTDIDIDIAGLQENYDKLVERLQTPGI